MKYSNCIVLWYNDLSKISSVLKGYRNVTQLHMTDNIGVVRITDNQHHSKIIDKLVPSKVNDARFCKNFTIN